MWSSAGPPNRGITTTPRIGAAAFAATTHKSFGGVRKPSAAGSRAVADARFGSATTTHPATYWGIAHIDTGWVVVADPNLASATARDPAADGFRSEKHTSE